MFVFAAILLATAALAGLSIQSVYREAQVRKRFIADTHRSIAELVSAVRRLQKCLIFHPLHRRNLPPRESALQFHPVKVAIGDTPLGQSSPSGARSGL